MIAKRVFQLFLAVSILAWSGLSANIASAEEYTGWHNGSKMNVSIDDGDVVITYVRPKKSLRKHGVRSGTVLFEGTMSGNRRIRGDARVFRRGCDPATYYVSGKFKRGRSSFTLRGEAPRRVSGGCRVVDYTNNSSNARLGFNDLVDPDDDYEDEDEDDHASGGGNVCGWYAIYSCSKSRSSANRSKNNAGYGKVVHTNTVPNFRRGYYCVVNGPTNKSQARQWRNNAKVDFSSAYIKKGC